MLDNYEQLSNGIIKQCKRSIFNYDVAYNSDYNKYKEKGKQLAFLRLGVILGTLGVIPNSIVDVGYGNGDFLSACAQIIPNCFGYDISEYPVPEKTRRINNDELMTSHFDIVCFFDSLEHFQDIFWVKNLKSTYILITLPWCHYLSDKWFEDWYHRKPDEHLWHFNKQALLNFFNDMGYENIFINNFEDTVRQRSNSDNLPNILCGFFKRKNCIS